MGDSAIERLGQGQLRQARDLAGVIVRARIAGLGSLLDQTLDVLDDLPELTERAAELLFLIEDAGRFTIGELGSRRVATLGTPEQRRELVGALIAYFEGNAAAAAAEVVRSPELDEIEAWAAQHGVAAHLDDSLRLLQKDVSWQDQRWLLGGNPGCSNIRSLFGVDWPRKFPAARSSHGRLKKAARAYLEARAKHHRQASIEEQQLLALPPPDKPEVRELYDRLRAARTEMRKTVWPRTRAELPRVRASLEPDPPTFVAHEDEWPHSSKVMVPLQARYPSEPLVVECSCSGGQAAPCIHALSVVDALMAFLTDRNPRSDAAPLLAALEQPAWARVLADLDAELAPPKRDAARLAWRVRRLDREIELVPVLQRPAKGGGYKKGSRARVSDLLEQLPTGALPADEEALGSLQFDDVRFVRRALLALVGHPRVTTADAPHEPVTVRTGTLTLAAVEHESGGVVMGAAVDGEPVDVASLVAQHDASDDVHCLFDEQRRLVTVVRIRPDVRRILRVLARRGGYLPREGVPALVERLPVLLQRTSVSLPPSLRGDQVPAEQRCLLRLEAEGPMLRVRGLVRPLPEGAAQLPGQGAAEIVGWRDGRRVFAQRDLSTEVTRARAALAALPLRAEAELEPFVWVLDRADEALDLVAALRELGEALIVEWTGASRQVTRWATRADLRVRIEDRRDWFGLSGELSVDGATLPLADLLEAIRARRRYVQVNDGLWVRIGDELRARLEPASDHVGHGRHGLEMSPVAAPALADLVDREQDAPQRFHDLLARIRAAGEHTPAPPEELGGALRDYQVTGYQWLSRLASWGMGGCLADDMGLGKTVQALALLSERARLGPALVVAPTSVAWNWVREAGRFTPGLRPILYHEVDRAQALAALQPGDVLVATYGLLARDAGELSKVRFATLVLDEAQAIKNPATLRARAAGSLQADFRIALSGTPVENRLAELWSLFRVVVPGLLGSWERFRDQFAAPIEKDRDPDRQAALARLMRPFILRRMKSEVARELPARTEVREEITLSPQERVLYDELRRSVVAELASEAPRVKAEQRRFQLLAALTRLRQLACHPRLVDDKSPVPSSKLERCLELIDELRQGNHRALIFSQFTSHLALLREALDSGGDKVPYLYLDGQTPPGKRQELVDAFQRGEGDVFLISLRAGGTGLNLTGADYVIHLDPWWNPAVEDQATDRAHRIGQDKPVTVYRLVARETIEDAIMSLHDDKRRLVAGILDGSGSAAAVTTEELLDLLRGAG